MEKLLDKVNYPEDLKQLKLTQLNSLCGEIRQQIVKAVDINGGHLSSNLGVVELSVALHYVFDCPHDKLIFDVGHQCYTHKILTGRKNDLLKMRSNQGISGFPKMTESKYDSFTMGHSSTSVSIGLGMAKGRDLIGENYNVVSIVGDGAFSGGLVYEALNALGSKTPLIIVLNDNTMSISKNVGALSTYFAKLRLSKKYIRIKMDLKKGVSAIPLCGKRINSALSRAKASIKGLLLSNKFFENLGIKYLGPFDGHNLSDLISVFKSAKKEKSPILIHVVTKKGKGVLAAEQDPSNYHGVAIKAVSSSSDIIPRPSKSFSNAFGAKLSHMAATDHSIVAITAAMSSGTGLDEFAREFPSRFFDVGIAEQHAATFACGLAVTGLKPYFAVYSSFLQRAYDQIVHDVCINNLPVTFCVDRAGVVGSDGITHQGIFDISFLINLPNMTIFAPSSITQLEEALEWSLSFNAPLAIRYPKDCLDKISQPHSSSHDQITPMNSAPARFPSCPIIFGKWSYVAKSEALVTILAVGNRALELCESLGNVNIVNACFVKPLDTEILDSLIANNHKIITIEDGVKSGGFGSYVLSYVESKREQLSPQESQLSPQESQLSTQGAPQSPQESQLSPQGAPQLLQESQLSPQDAPQLQQDKLIRRSTAEVIILGHESFVDNCDIAYSLELAGISARNISNLIK